MRMSRGGAGYGRKTGHPAGACLLPRLPTLPLVCFLAPYPPSPLPPAGKGGFLVFLCKGLRPLHPRELNPAALIDPAMQDIRRGMAFGFPPTTEDTDARQPSATPTQINATPPSTQNIY